MELFSLLAKLTLDDSEYNRKIDDAEKAAGALTIDEPELSLDDSDFMGKMSAAQSESVDDMTGSDAPKLGLDTREFEEGVQRAEESGETLGGSLMSIFDGIKGALVASGITAALTALVNLITSAVNQTTEIADVIDKQSKVIGISTDKYQEWDHALKQSGGSVGELSRGAIKFRDILDGVNDALKAEDARFGFINLTADEQALKMKDLGIMTEDQAEAFRKLGISVLDTNGNIKTSEKLIEDALLATSELSGDTQLKVINDLFGRNVQGITNLVAGGKEQVEELLGEAQDLGLVLSKEEIDNAVAYGDAVANLNAELDAIKSAFVKDIIPFLTDVVHNLTDIFGLLNPRKQETSLSKMFEDIDSQVRTTQSNITATKSEAERLVRELQKLGDRDQLDPLRQAEWNAMAQRAIELVPELSKHINLDTGTISENSEAIQENINQWEAMMRKRAISQALSDKEAAITEREAKAYEKAYEAARKESEANEQWIKDRERINTLLSERHIDKQFSDSSTYQDYLKWRDEYVAQNVNDYNALKVITDFADKTVYKTKDLTEQAQTLSEESENMIQEVEEARQRLIDEQKFLEEQFSATKKQTDITTSAVQGLKKALDNLPDIKTITIQTITGAFKPHAIGANYIPFDNYPALLHRGERVLTATEARQESSNFNAAELENRIESAIRRGMEGAQVRSYLNGKDITDEVNRQTVKQVKARRFA